MNINKTIISSYLISIILVSTAFSADLATIQTGSMVGDAAVVSGRGNIIYNYTRVDSLSQRAREQDELFLAGVPEFGTGVIQNVVNIDFTFIFDGAKIAIHEQSMTLSPEGTYYKRNWYWTYNGNTMGLYRLDPIGENGLIIPMGSLRAENQMRLEINDPRYDAMMIRGTPINEFIGGKLDESSIENMQTLESDVVDELTCDVLQGYDSETEDTITVWLSSEVMYRPVRIEKVSSREKTVIRNTFRNYGNGIWFPRETVREVYYTSDDADGDVLYSREILQVQDDFEINVGIPADDFETKFPVGMTVYDFRTGEYYDVSED